MKKLLLILSASIAVHAYAQNNDPGSFSDYKAKQIESIKRSIEEKGGLEEMPSPVRKPSGLRTAAAPQTISNRITIGCQDLFINGTNIAWVRFAMDVGEDPDNGTQLRPDMAKFESVFDLAQASGMNTIRWWLHVNGSHSPSFDNNNETSGLSQYMIEDMEAVLDAAWERNLRVQICLWSFDMLKEGQHKINTANTENLLRNDDALDAYIENALIPMVNGLEGHPGLLAWEIFNEPEGMSNEFGWDDVPTHVPMSDIQKVINRCTGAIHREDPEVLVTSGSWAFDAHTDLGSYNNYYTDEGLINAGGDEDGTLDFYNVHYYSWAGENRSPFHNPYSHWGLDKPLVVAEYYPNDQEDDPNVDELFGVSFEDLPQVLYETGYAGQMNWSETDRTWAQISGPINSFYNYLDENDDLSAITINKTACGEAYFVVSETEICQGASIAFSEVTDNAVSYSWSFGDGASMESYDQMTPPDITYSTSGEKTISLTVENADGDVSTLEKTINVISSESSYDVSIVSSASTDCQAQANVDFEASITPQIQGSVDDVTEIPGLSDWDVAATQNEFVIQSDGTIEGMGNAQQFILGNWHDWSAKEYSFTGTFGANASAEVVITIDAENTNQRELSVLIDDDVVETFDATNGGGTITVPVPAGTHTITYRNTGDDWVQAQRYTFSGLGVELNYYWYYNGEVFNEGDISATAIEIPTWSQSDEVYLELETGEIENCVSPMLYSDTLSNNGCITSVEYLADRVEVDVYPNPFKSSVNIHFEGEISVSDVNGKEILTTKSVGVTKIGESLSPGLYFVTLRNEKGNKVIKVIKQ